MHSDEYRMRDQRLNYVREKNYKSAGISSSTLMSLPALRILVG